jgi:hypothetical protein
MVPPVDDGQHISRGAWIATRLRRYAARSPIAVTLIPEPAAEVTTSKLSQKKLSRWISPPGGISYTFIFESLS